MEEHNSGNTHAPSGRGDSLDFVADGHDNPYVYQPDLYQNSGYIPYVGNPFQYSDRPAGGLPPGMVYMDAFSGAPQTVPYCLQPGVTPMASPLQRQRRVTATRPNPNRYTIPPSQEYPRYVPVLQMPQYATPPNPNYQYRYVLQGAANDSMDGLLRTTEVDYPQPLVSNHRRPSPITPYSSQSPSSSISDPRTGTCSTSISSRHSASTSSYNSFSDEINQNVTSTPIHTRSKPSNSNELESTLEYDQIDSETESCHYCSYIAIGLHKLNQHLKEHHVRKTLVRPMNNTLKIAIPTASSQKDNKRGNGISLHAFKQQLIKSSMVEVTVPGDGLCFINSLRVALSEYEDVECRENLILTILTEIRAEIGTYKQFITGKKSNSDIINLCSAFFEQAAYTTEEADLCISVAANALQINIHIINKYQHRVTRSSVEMQGNPTGSVLDIFLILTRHPGVKEVENHYNALVGLAYYKKNKAQITSIAQGGMPEDAPTEPTIHAATTSNEYYLNGLEHFAANRKSVSPTTSDESTSKRRKIQGKVVKRKLASPITSDESASKHRKIQGKVVKRKLASPITSDESASKRRKIQGHVPVANRKSASTTSDDTSASSKGEHVLNNTSVQIESNVSTTPLVSEKP